MSLPSDSSEYEDNTSVEHVPLVPSQRVDLVRDEAMLRNTERSKHRLLPERSATFDSCDGVDDAESQDAFDRSGDEAECQRLSVILIPCLNVAGEKA